jgi:hypothetical protein
MSEPFTIEPLPLRRDDFILFAEQLATAKLFKIQQPRAQAVVDVMIVIGDLIGNVGDLRLQAWLPLFQEAGAQVTQLSRVASRAMLEYAFACLVHEIQTREQGILLFKLIDDPEGLEIVFKATILLHAFVQGILAGVAERGMSQVMGQADGLGQVFI